jgi:peroxin-14
VERVVGELKIASRHREEESRRIGDEVRGLKDLIPKAMEGQKETTDIRLKELNTELKSLKTLMGQRMNPPALQSTSSYGRPTGTGSSTPLGIPPQTTTSNASGTSSTETDAPKPASVSNGTGSETFASLRNSGPFNTGATAGRAAIPAWQMAAANKSSTSVNATTGTSGGSQDVLDSA